MVFTDVRLQNYRSYADSSFELDGGVTIVVGPNATGKSNLIEAILLVANAVQYRGRAGIIKHGSAWARVDVHTVDNTTRTAKLVFSEEKENTNIEFVIKDKKYKRLPLSQKQPAVLFEPNNLLLMHGGPQNRRDYMDGVSGQLNDGYTSKLAGYKRALAQRNALLKTSILDKGQLFVWDVRLCELADAVVGQRVLNMGRIEERLSATYSKISGKTSELKITYKTPIKTSSYTAGLLKKLEKDTELDRIRGFTGSGPHREDFEVSLNKQPISVAASRGETRTLLLALKIIEMELLEAKTKNRPLLLLDDVFSELDGSRRKSLTKFLSKYQTIITTTDADVILKNFSQNCQIIPL